MYKELNNIYLIPILDDFLVYSPLNGISALINRYCALDLKKHLQSGFEYQVDYSGVFELAYEILNSPLQAPLIKNGELSPEFLGIIPTRSCNGSCNYCDFGGNKASSRKMSYKKAVHITDWYINLLEKQNRQIVEIHFFGGEPMMASDVIEVVVHRARLLSAEKKMTPYFEITSNGLYNEKKARFIGNYFNKVVLSLDGTEEIQNQHRPKPNGTGSFKNTVQTANIISKSQAELCLRACISNLNIGGMEQITKWFCETFNPSVINFEILCPTSQTRAVNLFPPDPYIFSTNFVRSREIGLKYGVQVVYASDLGPRTVVSACPVAKDAAIFSPDGRISNCYLLPERWIEAGLDLDFGNIDNMGNVQISETKLESIRAMVKDKPRCVKCFCKWSCAGGCHVGNTYPDCSTDYNDFCIQTRIISTISLLKNLGMEHFINRLLEDKDGLKRLALQESDLILNNRIDVC